MKRFNRTGLMATVISGVVALSCAGIGVAAWVVGDRVVHPQEIGGITANADSAQGVFVDIKNPKVTDDAINFGAVKNSLGYITSDEDTEDLTFAVEFDIDGFIPDYTLTASATASDDLKAAAEKGYIVLPYVPDTSFPLVIFESDGKVKAAEPGEGFNFSVSISDPVNNSYHVKVSFNFAWGRVFDGHNPVEEEIYTVSGKEGVISSLNDAFTALNDLKKLVTNPSIKLTLGK